MADSLNSKKRLLLGLAVVGCALGLAAISISVVSAERRDDSQPALATLGQQEPAAVAKPAFDANDPATWTDEQLAARLVLVGVGMTELADAKKWARTGFAGVYLFADNHNAPTDLKARIAAVKQQSKDGRFIFSSDEEGGLVQGLRNLAGDLPSAQSMGSDDSPQQISGIAKGYAEKMKALGVNMSLGPVADLGVPGKYMYSNHRTFATDPAEVGTAVNAWWKGSLAGGVVPVVKHWPGHGYADNTHIGSGTIRAWDTVAREDVTPFKAAFAAGAPAVMVGHLIVPGLTKGMPATQSARAIGELRRETGPETLIMTDSLTMEATTKVLHQSADAAAVRALLCGADLVLVHLADPYPVLRGVEAALARGKLPHDQAVASARRVLAIQRAAG